ncbi:MAG: dephospho-CoA kinase [Candidatus Omnitrophota bacterium]
MPRQKINKPQPYAQGQGKKIILGITGGLGSGKSTVAELFKTFGAEVIDADRLSHESIAPGGKCYNKAIKTFGTKILRSDKKIDRVKLGGIVFGNEELLKKLNNIIHPEVIKEIRGRIKESKSRAIVLDVPLLIESGLINLADKLIVVKIKRSAQIKRVKVKTSLTESNILRRINSQISLRVKARLADFVIDNSGTIRQTKKQAKDIWKSLCSLKTRGLRISACR